MNQKRKSPTLRASAILLAALLAASVSACGTGNDSGTNAGQEISDSSNAGQTNAAENNADESQAGSAESDAEKTSENTAGTVENGADNSDTNVTNNPLNADAQTASKISVTFEESFDEIKADDGTVICTNSIQMPVVSIEGADEIAAKINADLEAYYKPYSTEHNGTVDIAREDYASSLGEDGWEFISYSTAISATVTRMDDAVISFQLTGSDYTGGAHGMYGSTGRNYSAKTGELLAFDEISEDYEAFHATVLDYMINLTETPAYKDKLFGPPSKNDLDSALFGADNWVFTRSGISFLVAPYVLGPYASGEIHFRLPYERAYDLGLKEDYRYNGNFVEEHYYISNYDPETFAPIVDGTPDCRFDLDGDGTEEGLAFYGQVVDPATAKSSYAFYIDGKDYGDVIADALPNMEDGGYLEDSYALYHADAPDGGVPAIAVLFTEVGEGTDETGNPLRYPHSYIFGYTKEKGLYYLYREDWFVTQPKQP